ncbi:DEAD/DEAH box helicase [Nocardia sp. CNY236]|uniref:DEAD/DEAH box helicase n=1 Tax=Nocardia sp. CNY236 TaxID=1169152 RepID=UPI000421480E|nr:DEAD/DEAH box helicase [Nocardia sp. CNY236]
MLHGLWSPDSGLLLWSESPATTVPDERDLGLPDPLGSVLRTAKFRHRAEVLIGTPDGTVTERVRAHALAPVEAADLLRGHFPVGAVSGDLRFLAHVVRGIERWVRAGRVVPDLRRQDHQWWVCWRLVGGQRHRAWLAELACAMPRALQVSGNPAAVLDDMVTELTDPIARAVAGSPDSSHPLVAALVGDIPWDGGSYQLADLLQRWRASLTDGDEPDLVLRLHEPELGAAEEAVVLWRLEVCLGISEQAPEPVSLHGDPNLVRTAVDKLGPAQQAYPRLRDVPGDVRSLDMLLPTEVVLDLVEHGVHALRSAGVRLLLPRAWNAAEPSLRLRVDSSAPAAHTCVGKGDLVSYRWELALGDMVVTAAEMDRLLRNAADLVQVRGQWVRADHKALAAAARYITAHAGDSMVTFADLLGDIANTRVPQVPISEVTASGWVADLLDSTRQPSPVAAPIGLHAELRPYQQRGLAWLATMSRLGCGAILADDMGLGKTVQVLALLMYERENATPRPAAEEVTGPAELAEPPGPALLVCPMSVVGNWQREAARFAPDLRVWVHHGAGRRTGAGLDEAVAAADLVITTYTLLGRDIAELGRQRWDRVVLDEAQHIKNSGSRQAQAARSLRARHRVALTGTPVENRLEELRAIMDFVMPKVLGSPQSFRARFAVPIERERDQNAISRLRWLTRPFVLRRVKTDPTVITDLPRKFEMTARANLTAEQAALYQAVVDDMLATIEAADEMARRGAVLSALTRLKQVCNHPAHFLGDGSGVLRRGAHRSGKLALVEDVVDAVLADGEKVLLFTQFREFGELVAPYLAERFGVVAPFLHGGVPKNKREEMVRGFQAPDGPPLMLLSLRAGGTGLNLTAANHVVHLDRWWNPAVENQATDRTFRIGQQRNVQVRKVVCVDTVEERIDEMITSKRQLADLAVGAGENWITDLSTDELHDLFSLGATAVGE